MHGIRGSRANDDGPGVTAIAIGLKAGAVQVVIAVACGGDDDNAGIRSDARQHPDGRVELRWPKTPDDPCLHFEQDDIPLRGVRDGLGDAGHPARALFHGVLRIDEELCLERDAVDAVAVVWGVGDARNRGSMGVPAKRLDKGRRGLTRLGNDALIDKVLVVDLPTVLTVREPNAGAGRSRLVQRIDVEAWIQGQVLLSRDKLCGHGRVVLGRCLLGVRQRHELDVRERVQFLGHRENLGRSPVDAHAQECSEVRLCPPRPRRGPGLERREAFFGDPQQRLKDHIGVAVHPGDRLPRQRRGAACSGRAPSGQDAHASRVDELDSEDEVGGSLPHSRRELDGPGSDRGPRDQGGGRNILRGGPGGTGEREASENGHVHAPIVGCPRASSQEPR